MVLSYTFTSPESTPPDLARDGREAAPAFSMLDRRWMRHQILNRLDQLASDFEALARSLAMINHVAHGSLWAREGQETAPARAMPTKQCVPDETSEDACRSPIMQSAAIVSTEHLPSVFSKHSRQHQENPTFLRGRAATEPLLNSNDPFCFEVAMIESSDAGHVLTHDNLESCVSTVTRSETISEAPACEAGEHVVNASALHNDGQLLTCISASARSPPPSNRSNLDTLAEPQVDDGKLQGVVDRGSTSPKCEKKSCASNSSAETVRNAVSHMTSSSRGKRQVHQDAMQTDSGNVLSQLGRAAMWRKERAIRISILKIQQLHREPMSPKMIFVPPMVWSKHRIFLKRSMDRVAMKKVISDGDSPTSWGRTVSCLDQNFLLKEITWERSIT